MDVSRLTPEEIEALYRRRGSLDPATRALVEAAHAKILESASAAWVGTPASELDPVEAAATPIAPDPDLPEAPPASVRAKRAGAVLKGVDAIASDGNAERLGEFDRRAAARRAPAPSAEPISADDSLDPVVGTRGLDVEEAEAGAAGDYADTMIADMRRNGPQPRPGTPAWDAQGLHLNVGAMPYQAADERVLREEFQSRFGVEPRSQKDIDFMRAQLADERAAALSSDLSAAGYGPRRAPGARSLNGGRPEQGAAFGSVDDADAYHARAVGPDGSLMPSQRDADMLERGMAAVTTPEGVAYMVSADANPDSPQVNGGIGRRGYRPDLVDAGYEEATAMGPTGPAKVYRPAYGTKDGSGAGDKKLAYLKERQIARQADASGISEATLSAKGVSDADRRRAVRAAGRDRENERKAAWRAQTMLAGANPRKNLANAFAMMNDPRLNEEQRQSLQYMLPGGQLAAGVDAAQLQQAAILAQRAVTGALAGSSQGPMAQAQATMLGLQAQAERDKLRSVDEDVLGEKYAKGHMFPGWLGGGYDEFTIDEQQEMFDELVNSHGYSPSDAQRAVDRQAQKRRATERQKWNKAGG